MFVLLICRDPGAFWHGVDCWKSFAFKTIYSPFLTKMCMIDFLQPSDVLVYGKISGVDVVLLPRLVKSFFHTDLNLAAKRP